MAHSLAIRGAKLGFVAALVVLSACVGLDEAPELDSEPAEPVYSAPAPQEELRVQETERYITLATFEGYADPATGEFRIETTPTLAAERLQGQLTREQGIGFCELEADNDGNPGTGSVDTVELVTEAGTVFAALPFDFVNIGECTSRDPVGDSALYSNNPESFPEAARQADYTPLGVFCGNVLIRSFYDGAFDNVYAEITEFSGLPGTQGAYVCTPGDCPGTGAHANRSGAGGPDNSEGLWSYGAFGPADLAPGGTDEASMQWAFKLGSIADFSFRGRVIAVASENCGNGEDDDCNGVADDGCGIFPDGTPCVDDSDCAIGYCIPATGLCGDGCPGDPLKIEPGQCGCGLPDGRVEDAVIAQYLFDEGSGSVVSDSSGNGVDLSVRDPGNVSWIPGGGLSIDANTIVQSAGPPASMYAALNASNVITIEAYVRAANLSNTGPARVVTLSQDPNERNFTVGQDTTDWIYRQRTSASDLQGNPQIDAVGQVNPAAIQHVVATYSASDGMRRLYIDGVQRASSGVAPGDFTGWDTSMRFGLANEFTDDRPWIGELYYVAIHDRQLSPAEIQHNTQYGPFDGDADGDGWLGLRGLQRLRGWHQPGRS